jgi:segregation and condensation protein B
VSGSFNGDEPVWPDVDLSAPLTADSTITDTDESSASEEGGGAQTGSAGGPTEVAAEPSGDAPLPVVRAEAAADEAAGWEAAVDEATERVAAAGAGVGGASVGDRAAEGEANQSEAAGSETDREAVADREAAADGEADADGGADLAEPDRLRAAVEAVLLVVDVPTSSVELAQVLGRPVPEVDGALRSLRDEYDGDGRGMDLREVADGWRLYSREDFAPYVERFVLDGQRARLTQAALETLSVIAYRQPVTRSRISAIRGVSVDAVMRTLLTRGLVEECGADPDTGGGLYRTTRLFLEKLGLRSLDELPSLAPLLPDTSQLDDVAIST